MEGSTPHKTGVVILLFNMQINHMLSFENLDSFIPVWRTNCGTGGGPPGHNMSLHHDPYLLIIRSDVIIFCLHL